jgi:hypothetical protein
MELRHVQGGGHRRDYALTAAGRLALETETERMASAAHVGSARLRASARTAPALMRGKLAQAALRCYPRATRTARGAEMLDALLEASDDRHGAFVRNALSLVAARLGERARVSARLSAGRTIAEAAKLASILYACPWLTAGLAVLIERPGWHHESRVSLYMAAPVVILLAWSLGRQRLEGVIGLACTGAAGRRVPARPLAPSVDRAPIVPTFGYLIMAMAPTRERPSALAVGVLAGLVVVSVIVGTNISGSGQFIVLTAASIAGLAVFAVQPPLATAPAVPAATVARPRLIRRRAI